MHQRSCAGCDDPLEGELPEPSSLSPIEFMGFSSGYRTATGELKFALPEDVEPGDVLVAFIRSDQAGESVFEGQSWTRIRGEPPTSCALAHHSVLYRRIDDPDAEPDEYRLDAAGGRRSEGVMVAYRGVDDIEAIHGNSGSLSSTAPSVVAREGAKLVFASVGSDGQTPQYMMRRGDALGFMVADEDRNATGATGTRNSGIEVQCAAAEMVALTPEEELS
jgi:hypothetical protein